MRASALTFAAKMWRSFASTQEISLSFTLSNGQCFGWPRDVKGVWTGVLGDKCISIREQDGVVEYLCHSDAIDRAESTGTEAQSPGTKRKRPAESGMASSPLAPTSARSSLLHTSASSSNPAAAHAMTPPETSLRDFFQLDVDMLPLYTAWSAGDSRLSIIASHLPGMRVLRQAPWECLVSFICSSNNNIPRITQMVGKLRAACGPLLAIIEGMPYHAFPSPEAIAALTEEDLRALGLGYRAKFVKAAAALLVEKGGEGALHSLRGSSLQEARASLIQFPGVGPKVADCVSLFSLDQTGAVPVDTHVWAIACCYYEPGLEEAKSLTPSVYDRVGSLFRSRFGSHAGWAHCLLFAAELPSFREHLPSELRADMVAFRMKEKGVKAVKKAEAAARKRTKADRLAIDAAGGAASASGLDTSLSSVGTQGTGVEEEGAEGQVE